MDGQVRNECKNVHCVPACLLYKNHALAKLRDKSISKNKEFITSIVVNFFLFISFAISCSKKAIVLSILVDILMIYFVRIDAHIHKYTYSFAFFRFIIFNNSVYYLRVFILEISQNKLRNMMMPFGLLFHKNTPKKA